MKPLNTPNKKLSLIFEILEGRQLLSATEPFPWSNDLTMPPASYSSAPASATKPAWPGGISTASTSDGDEPGGGPGQAATDLWSEFPSNSSTFAPSGGPISFAGGAGNFGAQNLGMTAAPSGVAGGNPSAFAPPIGCDPATPKAGTALASSGEAIGVNTAGWSSSPSASVDHSGTSPTSSAWAILSAPTSLIAHAPSTVSAPNPVSSSSRNVSTFKASPSTVSPTSEVDQVAPAGVASLVVEMGDQSLPLAASVAGATQEASIEPPSNGVISLGILTDRDVPEGSGRSGVAAHPPNVLASPRMSMGIPPASDEEGNEAEFRSGGVDVESPRLAREVDMPDPQMADMILSLVPFDHSSLEASIQQFLEPFEDLNPWMTELRGPMGLVAASLTVTVTVLTVDLAIRLRRSEEAGLEMEGDAGSISFPGLPRPKKRSRS